MSLKLDENNLDDLVVAVKDASLLAGFSFYCSNRKHDPEFDKISCMAVTLLPSPFPRKEFNFAVELQKEWNKLLHLCANNYDFLRECFREVIKHDEFLRRIWEIYETVHKEGRVQKISLNVMRLDYMVDSLKKNDPSSQSGLAQVEINTFCCGGCALPSKVVQVHKYVLQKTGNENLMENLVENDICQNTVKNLIEAWQLYANPKAAIALLIRDKTINYCDHRLIEHELFRQRPDIKFIRVKYSDVVKNGRLDQQKRLFINEMEIALVFFKSGFDPTDFPTQHEWDARLLIERSMAIKAPKIEYQLICMKIFQYYLSEPGVLERFVNDQRVLTNIRDTFFHLYSFGKGKDNKKLIEMIKANYDDYILKPQRDGGGNNLFGDQIKKLFEEMKDESELFRFIVQKRMRLEAIDNYFLFPNRPVHKLKCTLELGIFGITISDESESLISNETCGYTLDAKRTESNESEVYAGFAPLTALYFPQ